MDADNEIGEFGRRIESLDDDDQPLVARRRQESRADFFMSELSPCFVLEVYRRDSFGNGFTTWRSLGTHQVSEPLRSYSWQAFKRRLAGVTHQQQSEMWGIEALEALGVLLSLENHLALERARVGLP